MSTAEEPRRRRPRRVRAFALGGGMVLALAAAGAAAVGFGGRSTGKPVNTGLPPATAQVARGTLVETQEVDGSLGYGEPGVLAGKAQGTVTWLPAVGEKVARGAPLYKVNNVPVVLLYGALPLYRNLEEGVKGPDVKQFEENLQALGYTGFTVDEKYDWYTAVAVRKWQKALGVEQTGRLEPSAAVVAAGELRVTEHKLAVGGEAAGPVYTYTGIGRVVTVDLDVRYQRLVKPGAKVTVGLPGGKSAQGTVASVGTVATTAQGNNGSSGKTTVKVIVAVDDQNALGSYDKAPVQVRLVADEHKDVLTVPVAALLALAEGGYGLQVVEGGSTRIVKVETGMFAGGKVEVRGEGIAEGTTVGMPT